MPPEGLCKRCGLAPVPECLNGHVLIDEYNAKECPNLKRLRLNELLRARLTQPLFEAPKITESPLYTPPAKRGEQAPINRTKENLFIRGVTYGGLLPHLRLVFACLPIKFKIVDDSRLRDVFVGGEAYKNRAPSARDRQESNNVVADLVGKEFDLVVIRLGVLAYKNIAAPGLLREALMVREGLAKPTWLFEDADPTVNWMHSRDADVEAYIARRFTDVYLSDDGPMADVRTDIVVDGPEYNEHEVTEANELAPQEDIAEAIQEEEAPAEAVSDFDMDMSMLGGGDEKKKFKKKGRW